MAVRSIMRNAQKSNQGIWYPNDYNDFLLNNHKSMPQEYWTGYANDGYFEKVGRFTFALKEGKSASEAIEAMLQGPSILDCGNAIVLAYYKALLDVIGSQKFDALFSDDLFWKLVISQTTLEHDSDKSNLFLPHILTFTNAAKRKEDGEIGKKTINYRGSMLF